MVKDKIKIKHPPKVVKSLQWAWWVVLKGNNKKCKTQKQTLQTYREKKRNLELKVVKLNQNIKN